MWYISRDSTKGKYYLRRYAKGETARNHKYIRKEGNRYIYDEPVSKDTRSPIQEEGISIDKGDSPLTNRDYPYDESDWAFSGEVRRLKVKPETLQNVKFNKDKPKYKNDAKIEALAKIDYNTEMLGKSLRKSNPNRIFRMAGECAYNNAMRKRYEELYSNEGNADIKDLYYKYYLYYNTKAFLYQNNAVEMYYKEFNKQNLKKYGHDNGGKIISTGIRG